MQINSYIFWLGSRYFFVNRKDNFGAFISTVSMLGILLGVAVLITVLSVMNGFSKEIRSKILGFNPHITLKSFNNYLYNWQDIHNTLTKNLEITAISPYIAQHGLLSFNGISNPVITIGVDLNNINNVYSLGNNFVTGTIEEITSNKFYCLLGQDLAQSLGVQLHDKISLIIPRFNVSIIGASPQLKVLTIGGIFKSGTPFDRNHIFLRIEDSNLIYKMHNGITGIQMKLKQELSAAKIAANIAKEFKHQYLVSDWTQEFSTFFDALKMEKTVMSCILLLIIAIAAFNLISSLIMLVTDKRVDIAVLSVLGATRKDIMLIFVLHGIFIGIIGTITGIIAGLGLSLNITSLVSWLQNFLGVKFISEEAYLIGFLPSDIHVMDVVWVGITALLMSFVATLYPAYRASNIKPAEALRYE